MLLGLPCEHGTSVPRQSGWYRRGCRHFSADSVLPRHYHCEIPSGRASGLSAFLEYYEREQSHQHSSSCQPLPPPCDLTPPDQGEGCGSQLTIGMGPSCSHFHYSLALLFSNSLFSSPPQGVFLFPTSASLSEFVFWCVSVCVCTGPCLWAREPLLLGLGPLHTYTSLRAQPSLDVYLDVCTSVTPTPNSLIPSLALYCLCGVSSSSECHHHHALI